MSNPCAPLENAEKIRRLHRDREDIVGARAAQLFDVDATVVRPSDFHDFVAEVLNVCTDGLVVLRMYRFCDNDFRAIFCDAFRE